MMLFFRDGFFEKTGRRFWEPGRNIKRQNTKERNSQVWKDAGGSQKRSRSQCREGTGKLCAEGGGLRRTWLERGWEPELPKIELPPLPSPQCSPSPLPFSLGHTPHASVQTHLLELTTPPTNCTPTPALGTQGILAMCSVPSAGGKKRSKKGKNPVSRLVSLYGYPQPPKSSSPLRDGHSDSASG